MKAAVIVACGGGGRRFGGKVEKQYLQVAGQSVLEHTLDAFQAHPEVGPMVLVLPSQGRPPELLAAIAEKYSKVVRIVPGGQERQDSVRQGLAALLAPAPAKGEGSAGAGRKENTLCRAQASLGWERQEEKGFVLPWQGPVLVQDGVRPCVSPALISRVIHGALRWGAAVPAIPVRDTLKSADERGRVLATLNRQGLWQIQTPQGFDIALLTEAYDAAAAAGLCLTDDAGAVEALGCPVQLVAGEAINLKLTYEEDLPLLEALLLRRRQP